MRENRTVLNRPWYSAYFDLTVLRFLSEGSQVISKKIT